MRTIRVTHPNKKALFINLFMKNSIEETWVRNKTENLKNTKWIKTLAQINDN